MISFRPLIARVANRLRRMPPFDDLAVETAEWAPATVLFSPAIIQLPDELDRVVAFNKTVTGEDFLSRCVAREERHPATIARRYDEVLVGDGSVHAARGMRGGAHIVHRRGRTVAWRREPVDLGPRLLASNFTVERYFGHWLLDGVCLELLAAERGLPSLGLHRAPWLQEPDYRAPLGLALERHPLARMSRLWIVDDRSMNAGHVARMRELRRRVRRGVVPGGAAPVFLRRVGGATRRLLNQDTLADALERRGFTVLTPEVEPVDTLRAALHDAPMVVSVEGSALCHAVACMADRGTVVAIQPPRRVDWIQKVWTDAAGLRLAQTVATDAGADGFTMEEDRLLRLFDLVARERAAAA